MKIIKLLNKSLKLNSRDIKNISNSLKFMEVKKNHYFLKSGCYNDKVAFLEEGSFRSFYYEENNGIESEVTNLFIEEGSFFTDFNSFKNSSISLNTFEALEDSMIYFFTIKDLMFFRKNIDGWIDFENNYFQNKILCTLYFYQKISQLNALEAYNLFIDKYQNIANKANKKYIASFLGLSTYTLSRLRL